MPSVTPLLRFDVTSLRAEAAMWENELRSLIAESACHDAIEEASEALSRVRGALERAEKNLAVTLANAERGVRPVSIEISRSTCERLMDRTFEGLREHRDLRNRRSFTYRGVEVNVVDYHLEHGARGALWYRGILEATAHPRSL